MAAHRGERLRVVGIVTSIGLRKVQELQANHGPIGFGGISSSVVTKRNVPYPYVYLVDPHDPGSGAVLLCYFGPGDAEAVSRVLPGSRIALTGDFQEYSQGGLHVVLKECALE